MKFPNLLPNPPKTFPKLIQAVIFLTCLVFASACFITPGWTKGPAPCLLSAMAKDSPLIVQGTFDTIQTDANKEYWSGILSIQTILKGHPINSRTKITVTWNRWTTFETLPKDPNSIAPGREGIWFLSPRPDINGYGLIVGNRQGPVWMPHLALIQQLIKDPQTRVPPGVDPIQDFQEEHDRVFASHQKFMKEGWSTNDLTIQQMDRAVSLGFIWKKPFAPLKVASVEPDSPAAQAGFRPEDEILTVERQPVPGVDAFHKAVSSFQPGSPLHVGLRRGVASLTLSLPLEPPKLDHRRSDPPRRQKP